MLYLSWCFCGLNISNTISWFHCVIIYGTVSHMDYILRYIPYFSGDNAHLMYNAHPKLFRISYDV
jgi:hypothetical protein